MYYIYVFYVYICIYIYIHIYIHTYIHTRPGTRSTPAMLPVSVCMCTYVSIVCQDVYMYTHTHTHTHTHARAHTHTHTGNVVGVHCVCQDVTSNRITKDSQEVLSAQLQQIVKLASALQPNFFDATESQFDFFPDKEQALLGEGAFGKTYKMRNKIDCEVYAVKMIKVTKMQKNMIVGLF